MSGRRTRRSSSEQRRVFAAGAPVANAANLGFGWGDIMNANSNAIKNYGLIRALEMKRFGSGHVASEGNTNAMNKKTRKAHFVRKGILERQKEEHRRAEWVRLHPGKSEANWERREAKRHARKAANRAFRKSLKKFPA